MDKDALSSSWNWFWFGGGALLWAMITGLRGYFRTARRDRIADLEAEVESLRRDLDELRRENSRIKLENSQKNDEILRLMRLLVAADARDARISGHGGRPRPNRSEDPEDA